MTERKRSVTICLREGTYWALKALAGEFGLPVSRVGSMMIELVSWENVREHLEEPDGDIGGDGNGE